MQMLPLPSLDETAKGSDQSETLIKKNLGLARQLQNAVIFCRI